MKKITVILLALCTSLIGQQAAPSPGAAKLPLHLGIVLLASKSTFPQQQAAATELVQTLIKNSGDEAFVISTGGDKSWPYPRLDWDQKPESLTKFIKGMDKNTGMPDAFGFHIDMSSGTDFRDWITTYKGEAPQASAFGIIVAMMNSDPRPARRLVVMFRDPWEHSKGWGGMGRTGDFARAIDERHDQVIQMLKGAGVSVFVIGIDDPSLKPQMQSELGSTYNTIHGDAGTARVIDEEFRKRLEHMSADGRNNLERIAKETGGLIAYGTKKNYADAVTAIEGKVSNSAPAEAGK